MLEELNSLLKKVFSNEETLVFALLLTGSFLALFFLGNILTPFLISLIFAYLLIGMQSRMEQYGMNTLASLIWCSNDCLAGSYGISTAAILDS